MSEQPTEYDDAVRGSEDTDTQISSEERDDLPISPPDQQPRTAGDSGGDASSVEETIDERIMQEEPDPDSAYGAPDNEGGLDDEPTVGGDDPDAIPAEDDVAGAPVDVEDLEPLADETAKNS